MEKTNFWNDAAKYGALLALAMIMFSFVGMYVKSSLLTIVSFAVFFVLLYCFTRRRTLRYGNGASGYSYGQCMKYIAWMMTFAGILIGAYEIVARNVLFTEIYTEQLDQTINALIQTGFYNSAQQEMMVSMTRSMFFSPIWIVVTTVLGWLIYGVVAGLIVSAFTKRDPDVFTENDNEQ